MLAPKLKAFTLLAALTTICTAGIVPITCPTDGFSILEDLVTCFEQYTVPRDYYTCGTYATAQPRTTPDEIAGWTDAVTHLLDADGTCTLPPNSVISDSYSVLRFTDSITLDTFCVLHERNAEDSPMHGEVYEKGWGLFITPAKPASSIRRLHFSAPHPVADQRTAVQAAAVFKRTDSKSLVIEGRHRHALSIVSAGASCFVSCQGSEYDRTDGAHDIREPFHLAMIAIHSWQTGHGGCPLDKCSYLQWHGKGVTTCPKDNVFLSSGFVRSSCYDPLSLPVNRIKTHLKLQFPLGNHATPADDTTCDLTATDNIFGRYVNGVRPVASACTMPATPCGGADFGQFVHIEQDSASRDAINWERWANVISGAFP